MLIRNFCVASKVKLEHAPEETTINGITPADDSKGVKIWIEKAHVDRFKLIVPKTRDYAEERSFTNLKFHGFYDSR